MGFSWCCGLRRTTALFKPFVMQTVIICASVHPQPVSALWRHPVLSPSYQSSHCSIWNSSFPYILSLSPSRSVTVWCQTLGKKTLLAARTTNQVMCGCWFAYSPVFFRILTHFQMCDLPGQLNFYPSVVQVHLEMCSASLQEHSRRFAKVLRKERHLF